MASFRLSPPHELPATIKSYFSPHSIDQRVEKMLQTRGNSCVPTVCKKGELAGGNELQKTDDFSPCVMLH